MLHSTSISQNRLRPDLFHRTNLKGLAAPILVWAFCLALASTRMPAPVPDLLAKLLLGQLFVLPGLLCGGIQLLAPKRRPEQPALLLLQYQAGLWVGITGMILFRGWDACLQDAALLQAIAWSNTTICGTGVFILWCSKAVRRKAIVACSALPYFILLYGALALFRNPSPWSLLLNISPSLPFLACFALAGLVMTPRRSHPVRHETPIEIWITPAGFQWRVRYGNPP